MKGIVYKSTGSWYIVKSEDGAWINCRIRGKLKIDTEITSTNPIAVGDEVIISLEEGMDTGIITDIVARKNYIVRVSPHNVNKQHILSSNLDQAIIMVTLTQPKTSLGFIDRFLVTCAIYDVPVIIVYNKIDLLDEEEQEELRAIQAMYNQIEYRVIQISCEENRGLDQIVNLLKDKKTLISGHSGVGKSTLINKLMPDLDIRTLEVSDWSGKGMHTTTFAQMYDLPFGGMLIDTPGIRELAIANLRPEELSGYFPEMKKLLPNCKYNNCLHINEPGCAVREAVENLSVHPLRYQSYLAIYESLPKKNY